MDQEVTLTRAEAMDLAATLEAAKRVLEDETQFLTVAVECSHWVETLEWKLFGGEEGTTIDE